MTIIKSYIVFNGATSQGGGSGTVTSFSSGDLSPLFTTSVATATTTPALTFTLTNQNANLVYAGPTNGAAAAPTFRSLVAADFPSLPYWKTSGTTTLIGATIIDCVDQQLQFTSTDGANDTLVAQFGFGRININTTVTGAYENVFSLEGADYTVQITDLTGAGSSIYTQSAQMIQFNTVDTTGNTIATGVSFAPLTWTIAGENITTSKDSRITGYSNDATNSIIISSTNAAFKGLEYSANYTANFVARSLIDKGYADATYAPITGGAYWSLASGGTLTGANTIAMSGFDVNFLNGNILSGPTGATITANTRLDVRGITAGNVQRWADNTNTTLGALQNDGKLYIGASAIISSTYLLQVNESSAVGAGLNLANTSTNGGASSKILLQNSANSGFIQYNSTGNSALGGTNSLNLGTSSATFPITFSPGGSTVRYSIGNFNHIWTQQGGTATGQTFLSFTQSAQTGGNQSGLLYTGGAHTGMTAGSSITDLNFNLARTIQWASNTTVTNYRGQYLQAPTLAFASATGTVTTAATLSISGAPIVGTNAAITSAYALNVEAGVSNFGGNIRLTQTVTSEALTSDRSVTIVINGTTYKLLAKV